jgi:hypothetical protein
VIRSVVALLSLVGLTYAVFWAYVVTATGGFRPLWWWVPVVVLPMCSLLFCVVSCFAVVPPLALRYGQWVVVLCLLPVTAHIAASAKRSGEGSTAMAVPALFISFAVLWIIMCRARLKSIRPDAGKAA